MSVSQIVGNSKDSSTGRRRGIAKDWAKGREKANEQASERARKKAEGEGALGKQA